MPARNVIAIDIGRRRLRALLAARGRSKLVVKRVLVEPVPESLDTQDAQAVGAWVGQCLREAGFPKAKATIAISRERVGLKRITLPTVDDDELPPMTRLALGRDLPFDADTAVIDFVTLERDETSTTVLAVAIPGTVLAFEKEIAAAAGLGIERISLRSMGSAALLGSLNAPPGDGALAVDITGEGVEFTVVLDGMIRFARAADLPPLGDDTGTANAVVTETRRTWMSYRIVEDSNDVHSAVVIGDREICRHAAGPIGEMLNVRTEVLAEHPLIKRNQQDMDGVWPLAGLLLEPTLGVQSIDFTKPRKAPDLAARKRQRVLAVAGVLFIGTFAAWTIGSTRLQTLERLEATLAEQCRDMLPQRQRFKRDELKLQHLRLWQEAHVDWLDHLVHLGAVAPSSDQLVLDSWTGMLDFRGVTYDQGKKTKKPRWYTPMPIKIVLDGEANNRMTADAFRDALVRGKLYILNSAGPDTAGGRRLPYKFNYRLAGAANTPPIKKNPPRSNQASATPAPVGEVVAHNVDGGQDS
ncbi:MAG: pilus assembly protein PilM [Planctomycetes bacterium]|nr:pilus assembly protein PilM [Planctomycetota bacterium]MCH8209901.1 pilus assembly protein PilM [Planctomycetota bacterium]MCH8259197.1 pilus assembly protein PilM [Planctomycetota bacterium]